MAKYIYFETERKTGEIVRAELFDNVGEAVENAKAAWAYYEKSPSDREYFKIEVLECDVPEDVDDGLLALDCVTDTLGVWAYHAYACEVSPWNQSMQCFANGEDVEYINEPRTAAEWIEDYNRNQTEDEQLADVRVRIIDRETGEVVDEDFI